MKATRLRGMAIVNIADAHKIGEVQSVILNPNVRHIEALRVKPVGGGNPKVVEAHDVHKVGKDALTIKDSKSVRDEQPSDLEGKVTLDELIDTKVLTHGGNLLGTVSDVEIDPSSFDIVGYDLSTGVLSDITGRKRRLRATEGVRYGKEILMVRDDVAVEFEGKAEEQEAAQKKSVSQKH